MDECRKRFSFFLVGFENGLICRHRLGVFALGLQECCIQQLRVQHFTAFEGFCRRQGFACILDFSCEQQ